MKKFILSLFVGFVGFINFSIANYITSYTLVNSNGGSSQGTFFLDGVNPGASVVFENYIPGRKPAISISCNNRCTATLPNGNSIAFNFVDLRNFSYYGNVINFDSSCSSDSCYIYMYPGASITYSILSGVQYPSSSSCPECPTCPEINTGEILSGYILESEIDTNYCVGNGLCPNECGSGSDLSGDLQYSNLYINDILHPGTPDIFVNIPDYITWDYTSNTGSFNLYVGSGYDMDYMNSIIKINSYRPDSQDFTNIFVSGLTLVFPYIAILLLIVFMWKLLKRIFK